MSAESRECAVQACAHEGFDLILMDMNMPGMGGIEAVGHIRAANPQRPLAGYRTHRQRHGRSKGPLLAAAMNGLVTKPFSPAGLLDEILRVVCIVPGETAGETRPSAGPQALLRQVDA